MKPEKYGLRKPWALKNPVPKQCGKQLGAEKRLDTTYYNFINTGNLLKRDF